MREWDPDSPGAGWAAAALIVIGALLIWWTSAR